MKNRYEIRGDVTVIFIDSKKYGKIETLINTDDLEKVKKFPNTWRVTYNEVVQNFYVQGRIYSYKKEKTVPLHRWVMDPPDDLVVDHINFNTLDNRRENLRAVTHLFNIQRSNPNKPIPRSNKARKPKKPRERRGTGVSWHKSKDKWIAYIQENGKQKYLGYFKNKEDALNAVEAAAKG
ncbi:HNH endonuclease [Bacillus sp. B15-48]|uniref:HNH endonuclease n=1 Tax=Bacillus sp. B15-48 TaxID=1548601 RepID=UPI00193EE02B|nr:HNH endonuclease [Bacillus sp. B15-48]MBM4762741.1 hypothetical protein [Bacillus sp. B15-48]